MRDLKSLDRHNKNVKNSSLTDFQHLSQNIQPIQVLTCFKNVENEDLTGLNSTVKIKNFS